MSQKKISTLTGLILLCLSTFATSGSIRGIVSDDHGAVPFTLVVLEGSRYQTYTDSEGNYLLGGVESGTYNIMFTISSHDAYSKQIEVQEGDTLVVKPVLKRSNNVLDQVVITGTMKAVRKSDSPVPVEVYSEAFFKANPTPSVYEALQNVNGVRPQINCAVCNTGDIHINGLEGPYTMVTIDGMPIVSGLSTVYGLSGIPQSLIDRVEIVKGPASTLYGSESVGGLINVITKAPSKAPLFAGDVFGTSWGEVNADLATKFKAGKKAESLVGVNYFNFDQRIDKNNDQFTDVTLQDRISVFNKWNFKRDKNRIFSISGRYVYEDRFGGDMDWQAIDRGGDEVYGESIYTSRWELFGAYQLPMKDRLILSFSANEHDQNSVYGNTLYLANQKIGFGQLTWNKDLKRHALLTGATMRYIYYDDNTPATANDDGSNAISHTYLPGIFIQDEIKVNPSNMLLLGMRYDYNSLHGHIFTPRINYKLQSKNRLNILRLSGGTGYRVVNIFTEDHAALSGAREVQILGDISPETSYNGNLNFVKKIFTKGGWFLNFDASVFYTYFTNKIIPDYETDPNKIIYDNIAGHAVSQGGSINLEINYKQLNILAGATAMDVYSFENGVKARQLLTEQFTATWSVGYKIPKWKMNINYTGNVYSPMLLPVVGGGDPRPAESPWWSVQNIQITKQFKESIEFYGGIKNLLNWVPWRNLGEVGLITRTNDPFDTEVTFNDQGQAVPTPNNPYALTFDPTYVYGPNQGIRFFLGFRYHLKTSKASK